jgi:hypothetical protein
LYYKKILPNPVIQGARALEKEAMRSSERS